MLTNLRQETLAHVPLTQMTVSPVPPSVTTDWRRVMPVLSNGVLTLRELRISDAEALLDLLSSEEVSRFISPPPTTVDGFERFIAWAQRERVGRAVHLLRGRARRHGHRDRHLPGASARSGLLDRRVGLRDRPGLLGTGVFTAAARLTIDFAFETVGINRLEARAAVANGRGNGALAKIGAVKEAILRRSFLRGGRHHDQSLWSIVREDWRQAKAVWGAAGSAVH